MDDLLLFTATKKSHMAKLIDLPKVLLKNGLKISPRKSQLFRKEVQYMGTLYLLKTEEYVLNHCKVDLKLFRNLSLQQQ